MNDALEWMKRESDVVRHATGNEPTPQEMGFNFLRHDSLTRATMIADLDRRIRDSDFSSEKSGLREAAKLQRLRRTMQENHERARRLGK